ncbi:ribosomal protein L22 [Blastocystis sp. subtype 4]|uniref:ribosomal protein L22 n=1 Tax=Blastocystis sp. subtype 4 TaxID=944170 RepID=UPI00071213C1|nr:ribosomal protein L22 [Blastocystis sp. subtype 4]KNB42503.1 ribosomal protein L22 [Blastocystis sp. subtype 4]|eukprot:XP_014525946.1 ribosomal protein L22 [Blastocystis sp. subtype 4]
MSTVCQRLSLCSSVCFDPELVAKKVEFTIDCSVPVKDKVMDMTSFVSRENYLKEHIKVDNKLNNMGSAVTVSTGDDKLSVVATIAFSKRYLKYLTKKYLKKQQIRDYLRVIASGKNGYKLTYFSLAKEE